MHELEVRTGGREARDPDVPESVFVADDQDACGSAAEVAGELAAADARDQPCEEGALADALVADEQVEVPHDDPVLPRPPEGLDHVDARASSRQGLERQRRRWRALAERVAQICEVALRTAERDAV